MLKSSNPILSHEWQNIIVKMQQKIRDEEHLTTKLREESALAFRAKVEECETLRAQLNGLVDANRRLNHEREALVDDHRKTLKELNDTRQLNERLERQLKTLERELLPESRSKRADSVRKKVVPTLELSADTEPISVFANHCMGAKADAANWSLTVHMPELFKAHTFYQFNDQSTAKELYSAVANQFGINNFDLGYLTYRKIESEASDRARRKDYSRTLAGNALHHNSQIFVVNAERMPKVGQLLHVMIGQVITPSDAEQVPAKRREATHRPRVEPSKDRLAYKRFGVTLDTSKEPTKRFRAEQSPLSQRSPRKDVNTRQQTSLISNIRFQNLRPFLDPKLTELYGPKKMSEARGVDSMAGRNPFNDNDYRNTTTSVWSEIK